MSKNRSNCNNLYAEMQSKSQIQRNIADQKWLLSLYIRSESKKTSHYNLAHNFAKCWLIFTILSLADSLVSLVNLQQNRH